MTNAQIARRLQELNVPLSYVPSEKAVRSINTAYHKGAHREFYTRRCPECLKQMHAFDQKAVA